MNKKTVAILLLSAVICIATTHKTQSSSGEMDVVSTHSVSFTNFREENIVVILNQNAVTDFEAVSYEIINKVINDDFQSVCFDWNESGYPNSLKATVFVSEKDWHNWEPLFYFEYNTDTIWNQYNIRDNPDEYKLTITE